MDKLKKWIIILVILILIILVVLFTILFKKDNDDNISEMESLEDGNGPFMDIPEGVNRVEQESEFFEVEKNLQNYNLYIKAQNKKALYELLSSTYKQNKNITEENVLESFQKIEEDDYEFSLKELYSQIEDSYYIYYANGILRQKNKKDELYYKAYVDKTTLSWEVEPIDEKDYQLYIKQEKTEKEKAVERNEYNKFGQYTMTTEDIAQKYFEDYIYNVLHDTEKAYQTLNEEYKAKRYGSIEKYKKDIEERRETLESLDRYSIKSIDDFQSADEYNIYLSNLMQRGLKSYSVIQKDDGIEYVCIDYYGNYYIFDAKYAMEYTVILDTYTIDLPNFIKEYDNSLDEKKGLLNIQKFLEAINNSDYEYAYKKLDEEFKNNNFKTLSEFENYAKQNFFNQNKASAINTEKQGDIFIYTITIKDASERNLKEINKKFVIQLKEERDFVMSFEV